jgi:tryptophan 2,3-dioxygenase
MSDSKPSGLYYREYLRLDKILGAQELESEKVGKPAHDEMLFIITHQTYELWFKQIVFELTEVIDILDDPIVEDKKMGRVLHLLARIKTIQRVLIEQIEVIETITPLDFLEFRDLLVPASGFQSIMFKKIEIMMGIRKENRIAADCEFFKTRLSYSDQKQLAEVEEEVNLFELVDKWLNRAPIETFEGFSFWDAYGNAVGRMLKSDAEIIRSNRTLTDREKEFQLADLERTQNRFDSLLDKEKFNKLRDAGEFRMSHSGFLAALFINLYRDEPLLYTGFRLLTLLTDVDVLFTRWRQRHAVMVQRMLGTKIGTGGSSGHDYLSETTRQNRVFMDLLSISTYLIPRDDLPQLPPAVRRQLGFFFRGPEDAT